jgi:hypothetical protein
LSLLVAPSRGSHTSPAAAASRFDVAPERGPVQTGLLGAEPDNVTVVVADVLEVDRDGPDTVIG